MGVNCVASSFPVGGELLLGAVWDWLAEPNVGRASRAVLPSLQGEQSPASLILEAAA